jgi:hypothetical protein
MTHDPSFPTASNKEKGLISFELNGAISPGSCREECSDIVVVSLKE